MSDEIIFDIINDGEIVFEVANVTTPGVGTVNTVDGVSPDSGGDIDLVEGSNVTITPDLSNNQITIASSGGGVTDHTALTNIGTNTHVQLDAHLGSGEQHRLINDSGVATTELWSANKISGEIADNVTVSNHLLLSNIGTNTHVQIDAHLGSGEQHRLINDSGRSVTELWSSDKISGEIAIVNQHTTDHTALTNIGVTIHTAIDDHISSGETHFIEGSIDHTAIQNIGTTTHTAIDDHISSGETHFTEASIDHTAIQNVGTTIHTAIDDHIGSGESHRLINDSGRSATELWSSDKISGEISNVSGGGGGVTDHTALTNIGVTIHTAIDDHIASGETHFIEGSIDHTAIQNIGTTVHTAIDDHIGSGESHRLINDSGRSVTELWSSDKISGEISLRAESSHEHGWSDVSKSGSNLNEIETRSHTVLSDIGTNIHPAIDIHIGSGEFHREIDDSSVGNTDLWSAFKISGEISAAGGVGFTDHRLLDFIGTNTHEQIDSHLSSGELHFTEGSIDHTAIQNIGTNTHDQLDDHISSGESHRLINDSGRSVTELWSSDKISGEIAIANQHTTDHTALSNIGTTIHVAIDDHISSGETHFTEASIDHTTITNIGTTIHTAIDDHIASGETHFTEGSIDHSNIQNVGTTIHTAIDDHIGSGESHRLINDSGRSTTELWSSDKISGEIAIANQHTIDHTLLSNIGITPHVAIDDHISSGETHFTEASIDHTTIINIGTTIHTAIDDHIASGETHFTETSIDHTAIQNVGTTVHVAIDDHISSGESHRLINDSGRSVTELWSSDKISGELTLHTHEIGYDDFDTDVSDTFGFFNGATLDTAVVSVTSSAGTITLAVEKSGEGDIRVLFSTGVYVWDCTPADTVTLTAGTDTDPVLNYVYLLESDKTLTVNTSAFPDAEHSPVGTVLCQSASGVETDGVYKLHAWTEHVADEENEGHFAHSTAWIRLQHATWLSGIAPSFSGDGTGTINLSLTSGSILQLHEHASPAFSSPATIYCVNDPDTAYREITNIADLQKDSTGASLTNKTYAIVFWEAVSEDDGDCKIFCNLPSGSESGGNAADNVRADNNHVANYGIPTDFKGTGVLFYRLVIKNNSDSTWTLYLAGNGDDIRGQFPNVSAGSTNAIGTEFVDTTFRIQDDGDVSKEIAFQASSISTGTIRTITMPDEDITLFTESSIDHTAISNIGNTAHVAIDDHIGSGESHRLINDSNRSVTELWSSDKISGEIAIANQHTTDHTALTNIGTTIHTAIDDHISSGETHFTEASIDHINIQNIGTTIHTAIDDHISSGESHRLINDSGRSVTELWSSDKISGEISLRAESSHIHGWSDVSKSGSNLNEIITRSHTVLSDIGSNTHVQLDAHLGSGEQHRLIDDAVRSATGLWSSDKISGEIAAIPTSADFITPGTFAGEGYIFDAGLRVDTTAGGPVTLYVRDNIGKVGIKLSPETTSADLEIAGSFKCDVQDLTFSTAQFMVAGAATGRGVLHLGVEVDLADNVSVSGINAWPVFNPSASFNKEASAVAGWSIVSGTSNWAGGAKVVGLNFGVAALSVAGDISTLVTRGISVFGNYAVIAKLSALESKGIQVKAYEGAAEIGTGYGIHIIASTSSQTVTTSYQLRIEKSSAATTDYQVWLDGTGADTGIWFNDSSTRLFSPASTKIQIESNLGIGMEPSVNADLSLGDSGVLNMLETATPTADTNYGKVYTQSDNKLYFQDGAGTEHEVAFV